MKKEKQRKNRKNMERFFVWTASNLNLEKRDKYL